MILRTTAAHVEIAAHAACGANARAHSDASMLLTATHRSLFSLAKS